MARADRRRLEKELDKAWSLKVRSRGNCERCGKLLGLQAAHIISRTHRNTRWDLENGLCLCGGCHIFFAHKEPLLFAEFVKKRLGQKKYESLIARGQVSAKPDLEMWRIYLEQDDGHVDDRNN